MNRSLRAILVGALCALFLLLAGGAALLSSQVYRTVAAAAEEHYTQRTVIGYLVNQVRTGRETGTVTLTQFGGSDALSVREGAYETLIYCYDGQLMELYTEAGLGLGPDAGTALLTLESMRLAETDGLLTLSVTDGPGNIWTGEVSLR